MSSYPSAPKYDKQADLNEQNRINQAAANQQYANLVSDLGGYSVSVDPKTGRTTINKNLGNNSKQALFLQNAALNAYKASPEDQKQQYYDMQMAYVQPYLDEQRANVMKDLEDKGIPVGSSAYNSVMANLDKDQNNLTNMIAADAIYNGQDYNMNMLNQAAALGSQVYEPGMIQGIQGVGLSNTSQNELEYAKALYATNVANANAKNQAIGQGVQALGSYLGSRNWNTKDSSSSGAKSN
ncbi:MAG: hypothetical protein J6T10_29870 [Methanobrevibacter sp.]|nr:hypothetical protein [Methanobrevibacter sp.]